MVINIDTDKLLQPKAWKPYLGTAKFTGLCVAFTFGVRQWQAGNIYTAVAILAAVTAYAGEKLVRAMNDTA